MVVAMIALVAGATSVGVGRAAAPEPTPDTPEKRGCCSHHKGVCGCEGASAKCCDGTLSPTCGC